MKSIAFLRNNNALDGAPLVDPFRFFCKLDELANVLLMNESFLIVSYGYEELPSLAHWLGLENLRALVESDSLKFLLLPQELATKQTAEDEFYFVLMGYYQNFDIHSPEGRLDLLKRACRNKFAPDGFTMPDELAKLIADKSWATGRDTFPKKFMALLVASARKVLELPPGANLPHSIRDLSKKIRMDESGIIRVQEGFTYDEAYREASLLTGALKDILVSYYFDVPLLHTSAFISSLSAHADGQELFDEKTKAFVQIVDLHRLPVVGDGVYSGSVTGDQIMALRNTQNARKFREWLLTNSGPANEIIANYLNETTQLIPQESIKWPAARLVTTSGIGIANTPLGILASFADFAFTRQTQKPAWKPNFFIRGDYEQSLSQSNHQGTRLPVDLSYLLNRGYKIIKHQASREGRLVVHLSDEPGSSINLHYGAEEAGFWKSQALEVIEKAPGASFHFECPSCGKNCRVISPGKPITAPRCRCSSNLF